MLLLYFSFNTSKAFSNLLCSKNIYSTKKNKLLLLEDNCESLGAKYQNKLTGTFGLMSSFSFFFSHHISTMEGGMILTDNEELYQILLCLRSHGWTRSLPKKNLISGKKSKDLFYDLFNFVLPG